MNQLKPVCKCKHASLHLHRWVQTCLRAILVNFTFSTLRKAVSASLVRRTFLKTRITRKIFSPSNHWYYFNFFTNTATIRTDQFSWLVEMQDYLCYKEEQGPILKLQTMLQTLKFFACSNIGIVSIRGFNTTVLIHAKTPTMVKNNGVIWHPITLYSRVTLILLPQLLLFAWVITVFLSAFSRFIHSFSFFF